jgi:regulator of PEP synthase PpsR (kinase-PPPase family)
MVRSPGHIQRIMVEVADNPGLVLFTLVNGDIRAELERRCAAIGLPAVAALDTVNDALSRLLGQEAKARPGRQHMLDDAYYARVEAIHYTMAHDDGIAPEGWEDADIVLAGVSRSSKTPTSIYLANRGYKTANIPIVPESPPPQSLYTLLNPLVVGLTTSPDRLVAVRRNRLSSMGEDTGTSYADEQAVKAEIAYARRMFADNDWPVIDVTRRSIEETAAAIIKLCEDRRAAANGDASGGATA